MMYEKTGGIRIKIIMGSLLVFLAVIFFVYTYNVISVNKAFVWGKTESSTHCLYMDYEINGMRYLNHTLTMNVKNMVTSSCNITLVTIIDGSNKMIRNVSLVPSQMDTVMFSNITNIENVYVYMNDCNEFKKKVIIR